MQQLNKQAARDAELRASRNAGSESRLSESASVPEEPLPTLRSIVGTAEGSTSSVGNEVAQISAMKVQLARLKGNTQIISIEDYCTKIFCFVSIK